jgi:hypothetical protein
LALALALAQKLRIESLYSQSTADHLSPVEAFRFICKLGLDAAGGIKA